MTGRLEAPGREGRAGNAGFGEQEIAELGGARAADFLVRHHGDGCELVGHDRKHALLRCGSSRRRLWLWRALAIAAGSGPGDAHRRACRNNGPVPLNRARRRHGDVRQLRRGRRGARPGPSRYWRRRIVASQLAPPMWNALVWNFIVPILIAVDDATDSISIFPRRSPRLTRATVEGASINRSQERGGARDWNAMMRRRSDGRTRRRSSGREVRRPAAAAATGGVREQHIVREGDDGADRARVGRMLIAVGIGWLLLLGGCAAASGARPAAAARSACVRPVWIAGAACAEW